MPREGGRNKDSAKTQDKKKRSPMSGDPFYLLIKNSGRWDGFSLLFDFEISFFKIGLEEIVIHLHGNVQEGKLDFYQIRTGIQDLDGISLLVHDDQVLEFIACRVRNNIPRAGLHRLPPIRPHPLFAPGFLQVHLLT